MAPKLPNHLASLLRHQAPEAVSAGAPETEQSGRAARKKAARAKRRSKAKETRAADRAEQAAKKQIQAEAEVSQAAPTSKVETKKKKLLPKKKSKVAAGKETKAAKKPPSKTATSSTTSSDRDAARDEALLQDLEKKLGIAGNSKRRRKEEKQIFADLFEAEDLGIEELPSSDDDAEGPKGAGLEALKDEDMVGLLDSILGTGETTSRKIKAKVAKKKSKA